MQGGSHLFLFSGCINSPLAATVANHCLIPPVLPTERVTHGGAQETYCGAGFSTGLCRLRVVCVRSKRSDLAACPLCPESRQIAVSLGMSALCHNRLMRCSKQRLYSITSSATASSDGEISRPARSRCCTAVEVASSRSGYCALRAP
jgi:hypothetical protein